MKSYLEFEREIKVLEEELATLKDPFKKEGLTEVETDKINKIQAEIDNKLKASLDHRVRNALKSHCLASSSPSEIAFRFLRFQDA